MLFIRCKNGPGAVAIRDPADLYHVEFVVNLTWHVYHTDMVEPKRMGLMIKKGPGLPLLNLYTDYRESLLESLYTRIEMLLEII